MNTIHKQRIEKLSDTMKQAAVNLAVIVPGANLRYLTGLEMHSTERITLALIPQGGQPVFVLPVLEAPRVRETLAIESSLYTYSDEQGPGGAFRRMASDLLLEGKVLGVEHLRMRVLELRQLEECVASSTFVDVEPLLSQLRITKDEAEIEAMRRAAAVNQDCFRQVQAHMKSGVSEKELAAIWQKAALDAACGELPEAPIVAAGLNGASPHAWATSRTVAEGDLVTIDAFVRADGYYSDITRTYGVGEVDEELQGIYSVVEQANAAARDVIRPGIEAQEVDRAARRVIEKAGYGEYFIHRTGHGLGLEIHEPPYIVEGNDLALRPGMTFTVEPGIYVPGRGGVRIEDNVLVTEDGCESLTTLPRELIKV